jgi:hypothetical protein
MSGSSPGLKPDRSMMIFLATLAGAFLFVYHTSGSLPEAVASHFDRQGAAIGFLPRAIYVRITLGMVLLPPIFLVVLPRLSLRNPSARINVPNRAYWLAPKRRERTVAFIAQQCTYFGVMLLLFLCYAHWLVVRANAAVPATLSSGWILAGLVVFLGFTVRWATRMIGRFRRTEDESEG